MARSRRLLAGLRLLAFALPGLAHAAPIRVDARSAPPVVVERLAIDPDLALEPRDGAVGVVSRDGALEVGDVAPLGCRALGRTDQLAAVAPASIAALAGDIAWASAPSVGARVRLVCEGGLVVALAGADPLIVVGARGVVIAADLAAPSNRALVRWGFLPFVLHAAIARAAGREPGPFARFRGAPVPQRGLTLVFGLTLALLLAAAVGGFAHARRRAAADPDAHRRFFAALATPPARTDARWTRPGVARPLGGFFLFLSATLLALGPYLYLTAVLVPSRVQPFPDVDGAWAPIEDLALLVWSLSDFGITVAFVQRFAEHRVRDPPRALKAAQLFVWWQIGIGFLQFAVGGAFACAIIPHTRYALFSDLILARALLAPGLLALFAVFFQAVQRFDFQLALDMLEQRLLIVVLPIPFVLLLRAWGRAHPEYGEALGAALGLAAGHIAASGLTCAVGFVLYRRLGLPLGPLFLAGFDRRTAAELFRFGAGVVAGKAPFFLANGAELWILTNRLAGYPMWLGIRQLVSSRLIFVFWFLWPFIDSALPALAEALSARKHQLVRYYVVRYLQFGHLFVAVVTGVLLGAGQPLLVRALSPEWIAAARYLPLAAAAGLLLPSAWLTDVFQKSAGRAGLNAAILWGEQIVRVILFYLLVPRMGLAGVFAALLVTVGAKSIVGWWVNHRYLVPLVARPFSTLVAPIAAGALIYGALRLASRWLPHSAASAIGLFVVAALLCFPLGFFLVALLGGIDDAAIGELGEGAELASVLRRVAAVLVGAARLGRRLCPVLRPAPALALDAAREADEIAVVEATEIAARARRDRTTDPPRTPKN